MISVIKNRNYYSNDLLIQFGAKSFSCLNEMEECPILVQYPDFPKELIPQLTDPKDLLCLWLAHPEFHVLEIVSPKKRWEMLTYTLQRGKREHTPLIVEKLLQSNLYDPKELEDYLPGMSLNGRTEIVRLLLKYGADPNAIRGGALINAVGNNHLEIVRLLLDAGADLHISGFWPYKFHVMILRDAPLMIAIANGNLEMAKLLLDRGADVNAELGEPLRIAVDNGNVEMAKLLLDSGANVSDFLWMELSKKKMNISMVNLLIEYGTDLTSMDFIWAAVDNPEVVKLLLEAGAEITPDDLLQAVKLGEYESVKLLLESGADPNKPYGQPLKVARTQHYKKITDLLIQYGAK